MNALSREALINVMAGLVPAIHVFKLTANNDACPAHAGHDEKE